MTNQVIIDVSSEAREVQVKSLKEFLVSYDLEMLIKEMK